jgi:hypothetical protein
MPELGSSPQPPSLILVPHVGFAQQGWLEAQGRWSNPHNPRTETYVNNRCFCRARSPLLSFHALEMSEEKTYQGHNGSTRTRLDPSLIKNLSTERIFSC